LSPIKADTSSVGEAASDHRNVIEMEREEGKGEPVDYDKVLDHLGQFGAFQKRIFFWLSFVSAAAGLAVVAFAFTGYEPNYRCRVSQCDKDNSSYYDLDGRLPAFYKNKTILWTDRCMIPVSNSRDTSCEDDSQVYPESRNDYYISCETDELIFDKTILKMSLVQEFGFVCDRSTLRTLYNAIYMLGMLLGSYFFGYVSDKYGRMNSLLIAVLTVSLSGFFGAFCGGRWGHYGFGLLRLLTGMGGIGCFMVSFVLVVEHVGSRFTALIGVAIEIPFAVGQAVLGMEAYLVRDWRTLQILAHLPLLAIIGIYWVVPESVRWLLANGKIDEAKEVIIAAAKTNKIQVPTNILDKVDQSKMAFSDEKLERKRDATILDVFRNKRICFRTLNMCYQVTLQWCIHFNISFTTAPSMHLLVYGKNNLYLNWI